MKDTNKRGDANRDPITCEPGAHPVGTGIGAAAGGAAAGAAVGTVAGPVGTGLGAAAGAIIGGLAGKAGGEAANPTISRDWVGSFITQSLIMAAIRLGRLTRCGRRVQANRCI